MNQNDALIDLCKACVQDAKLTAQQGWQKLILIAEVTSASVKAFGYSYSQQGECQWISPSLDFDMDKLRALQQVMQTEKPNGRGWLKCMIRISRAGEVGADFGVRQPQPLEPHARQLQAAHGRICGHAGLRFFINLMGG